MHTFHVYLGWVGVYAKIEMASLGRRKFFLGFQKA